MLLFFSDSEESDGWETVQRGGKGKQKSPSQRSLENLHTVARPEQKLTRSVSDPNACIEKYKKNPNIRGKGPLPQRQPKGMKKEFQSNRPRMDSKDSEKENIPDSRGIQTEVVKASVASANINGPIENKSPSDSAESVIGSEQSKPHNVDRQIKSVPVRKAKPKPKSPDKIPTKPNDKSVNTAATNKTKVEERSHSKAKGPSSGGRQNAWAKPLKVVDKEQDTKRSEDKHVAEVKQDSVCVDVIQNDDTVDTCMTEEQADDQLVNEIDNVSFAVARGHFLNNDIMN